MKLILISIAVMAVLFAFLGRVDAQVLPTINITSVAADSDSAKIDYAAVPGAKDYRVYDISNPMAVKYAGVWHLDADQLGIYSKLAFATDASGNVLYPLHTINAGKYTAAHHIDVPSLEIEMNGLAPGQHTLVVQAVDAIGPCPPANLYDANNLPTMNAAAMSAMGGEGMDTMLGANAGTTANGMVSTNGQGPATDNPNVIAQSQPFTVTTTGASPFPSAGALDSFFDTFPSGTFAAVGTPDIKAGNESFVLTTPEGAWDIFENHCDLRDTRPFVMNRHYMAVDFDGGSPGSNEPLHVAYSGVAISPQKVANIAGGAILHATMDVDAHTDARRWIGFQVCDASDPLRALDWEEKEVVNNANTVFTVQWEANNLLVDEIVAGKVYAITGAAGQASHAVYRTTFNNWQFGRGLDDRSRFDLFLCQTHFAVFEDGVKQSEYDMPVPLPFAVAKVYDVQYLYHSDLEKTELQQQRPFEQYWIADFPSSDERHWSACGWETLPASTAWPSLASLIQMPKAIPPAYVPPAPSTVPVPAADATIFAGLTGNVTLSQLQAADKAIQALEGQIAQ